MDLEKDVGNMLVFIVDNKDQNRGHLMADRIFEVCEKYGTSSVLENLKDRSQSPLIFWTIDVINDFSKTITESE